VVSLKQLLVVGTQDEPDEVMNEINMTPLVDRVGAPDHLINTKSRSAIRSTQVHLLRATSYMSPSRVKPQNILLV
jgi:biopolymer transport protein ExbD